jgi:hypothetical protein
VRVAINRKSSIEHESDASQSSARQNKTNN